MRQSNLLQRVFFTKDPKITKKYSIIEISADLCQTRNLRNLSVKSLWHLLQTRPTPNKHRILSKLKMLPKNDCTRIQHKDGLGVMLGLTFKSLTENEENRIMFIAYTLTLKMKEDQFGEVSLNINQQGDEIPRYRNRRYNQAG